MAKLKFNAAKAKPMEERKTLPEGEYLFQIVKSELVDNKAKTAQRMNLQAKVLNGENKGAIAFIGLNWNHPNQIAQDISDREFKSICDAVGKGDGELEDTTELHGIPFVGTVKLSAPSGKETVVDGKTVYQYPPKAEIKKYESANGHSLLSGADVSTETTTSRKKTPWDDEEETKEPEED